MSGAIVDALWIACIGLGLLRAIAAAEGDR